MPKLLRFIIWHLSTGFALGAVTTLVIAFRYPHALGHDGAIEPIALLLQIYAFGASFALGCLGTALMERSSELASLAEVSRLRLRRPKFSADGCCCPSKKRARPVAGRLSASWRV